MVNVLLKTWIHTKVNLKVGCHKEKVSISGVMGFGMMAVLKKLKDPEKV